MFGKELSRVDLEKYSDMYEYQHVEVRVRTSIKEEIKSVIVWFDTMEVINKDYPLNHSCDMFQLLDEALQTNISIFGEEQVEEDQWEDYLNDKAIDNLSLVLGTIGIDKLQHIYRFWFKRGLTNMKASSTPLQTRKDKIITAIMTAVVNSESLDLAQKILDTHFPDKKIAVFAGTGSVE
jgi:hypothetical protein